MGVGKDSVMYQTILRQPADLRGVLGSWDDVRAAGRRVASASRVYIVGIGTSYHAALMGGWCMRWLGFDAHAVSSFDFARYPDTYPLTGEDVVIVLSHSGAKQFSLAALEVARRAGAALLSVGGHDAEHPGSELILRTTERERSAAFTSSHTTAMTVLAQVATEAAVASGHARADTVASAVMALPDQIEEILAHEQDLDTLAQATVAQHTYVVGGGPSEVAALEAVIKAREAAYVRVDGMALEQFIHGPTICLQPEDHVLLINVGGESTARNSDALALFRTLGPSVTVVGRGIDGEAPGFDVPETLEVLSPILTTVPMQLWAWRMATLKGLDPDTFRRQEARFQAGVGAIQL